VVQNLVGNAVKYSGGALRVEITAVRDGPWVRVAVEDRGTGITSEEASQVFTPFFRSERTSSSAGGIGLGLAVCKRLVEVQHGRIWAEPRPGGGTTVAFTLPLEVDRDD
jgi:two-component system sensor histidine kinase KdpD